jgi:3'(2'), 5'-bisphosphate nucleotidase
MPKVIGQQMKRRSGYSKLLFNKITKNSMHEFVRTAVFAAVKAGWAIMEVYESDFTVEAKADNSPLTLADQKSHTVIENALIPTKYPILSEEGNTIPYEVRNTWTTYWLIDPLDGTKEFIKRNGEFTVNIALVRNGEPVLGVVYVPVTGVVYYGVKGEGSYMLQADKSLNLENLENYFLKAVSLPILNNTAAYAIIASKSHSSPETEEFIKQKRIKFGAVNLINAGSSLKLCLVAEGKAQVYPRLAPTMEWDTAAGHAVAKYAGCKVYDYHTGSEISYNKENLLNPWFVVERLSS